MREYNKANSSCNSGARNDEPEVKILVQVTMLLKIGLEVHQVVFHVLKKLLQRSQVVDFPLQVANTNVQMVVFVAQFLLGGWYRTPRGTKPKCGCPHQSSTYPNSRFPHFPQRGRERAAEKLIWPKICSRVVPELFPSCARAMSAGSPPRNLRGLAARTAGDKPESPGIEGWGPYSNLELMKWGYWWVSHEGRVYLYETNPKSMRLHPGSLQAWPMAENWAGKSFWKVATLADVEAWNDDPNE